MRFFEESYNEWMRERDRRIGPINFRTKLNEKLQSPDSRLTSVCLASQQTDYTITLLPQRPATGGGHFIHGRLLLTITAKTICQMERAAPTETPHRS